MAHDKLLDYLNYRIKQKVKKGHKWNVYTALISIKKKWIELKPKQGARLFIRWLNAEITKRETANKKWQFYVVARQVREKYYKYYPLAE